MVNCRGLQRAADGKRLEARLPVDNWHWSFQLPRHTWVHSFGSGAAMLGFMNWRSSSATSATIQSHSGQITVRINPPTLEERGRVSRNHAVSHIIPVGLPVDFTDDPWMNSKSLDDCDRKATAGQAY